MPEKTFATIRSKVAFDKIDGFFNSNIPNIVTALTNEKISISGHPHGISMLSDAT
jgi:hypothetical protein